MIIDDDGDAASSLCPFSVTRVAAAAVEGHLQAPAKGGAAVHHLTPPGLLRQVDGLRMSRVGGHMIMAEVRLLRGNHTSTRMKECIIWLSLKMTVFFFPKLCHIPYGTVVR